MLSWNSRKPDGETKVRRNETTVYRTYSVGGCWKGGKQHTQTPTHSHKTKKKHAHEKKNTCDHLSARLPTGGKKAGRTPPSQKHKPQNGEHPFVTLPPPPPTLLLSAATTNPPTL